MEYIPGLDVWMQIQKFVEEEKIKTITFNQQPIKFLEDISHYKDIFSKLPKPETTIYFKYASINDVAKDMPDQYRWLFDKLLSFRKHKHKYTSIDFYVKHLEEGECPSNTVWHWDGKDYNFQDPDRYVIFHTTEECKTLFIPNPFIYIYSENTEKGEFINKELNPYLDKINLRPEQVPEYTFTEYNSLNLHRAVRASSECTRLFMRLCESNHIQPRE